MRTRNANTWIDHKLTQLWDRLNRQVRRITPDAAGREFFIDDVYQYASDLQRDRGYCPDVALSLAMTYRGFTTEPRRQAQCPRHPASPSA